MDTRSHPRFAGLPTAALRGVALALLAVAANPATAAEVDAPAPEAPRVISEPPDALSEPVAPDESGTQSEGNDLDAFNHPLATVGSTEVTAGALVRFTRKQPLKFRLLATPEGQATMLREFIDNLVVNTAAQEASELGPDPTHSAMEDAVRDLERAQWPADEPTEEQVRSYYDAHRDEFGIPAAVRIREIFFPLSADADAQAKAAARARAEEVLAAARAGEPFEQLARKYAHTDALRSMGGDQKFLPLYKFPHLAVATASMNEGDLSDVIELSGGLQIFQYLGRREAIPATYEVAAMQIKASLAEASRAEKKQRFIEAYGNRMGVRILDPRLSAAWPSMSAPTQSP